MATDKSEDKSEDKSSNSSPAHSRRRHSSVTEQITNFIEDQLELDRKNSIHDDVIAIERFYEMKDATSDTFTYTFFVFEALLTCFLLGFVTKYFYIVQTFKAIFLLSLRFYVFKKIGKHYFFLELCTWVHFLTIVYLWSPWKPKGLFPVIFMFANGPLIWSVLTWRNAFVPHSLEKMCTLFIHISPALLVWSIRWYSSPEQGFELCADPTEPGINGCNHVTFFGTLMNTTLYFAIWITYYILIIFVWRAKRIKERGYLTAYNIMSEVKGKTGFFYRVANMAGPKYKKFMYFGWTCFFSALMATAGYYTYHSLVYHYIYIFLFTLLASYNGATFYIRVVGKKYYNEDSEKKEQ